MLPQIHCYHSLSRMQLFTFYLLSKGDNAGKPGFTPWANSFAVHCSNEQSYEFYYWLAFCLFKSGKFKTRHRGSVIQFINLNDVRELLREVAPALSEHWQKYQQLITAMNKLEQRKISLNEIIVATERLQQYLVAEYFPKQ